MPSPPQPTTPAQQERLRMLIHDLRAIAEPVGPLHGFWDRIFELDALVRGLPTLLPDTVEDQIAAAEHLLASYHARRTYYGPTGDRR